MGSFPRASPYFSSNCIRAWISGTTDNTWPGSLGYDRRYHATGRNQWRFCASGAVDLQRTLQAEAEQEGKVHQPARGPVWC